MRLQLLLTTAAVLCSLGTAHADTITTFNLNANLDDGGTVTGTVTLNTTTGVFTASNLTGIFEGYTAYFSGTSTRTDSGSNFVANIFQSTNYANTNFQLVLPVSTLRNYTPGGLCTAGGANCSTYDSSIRHDQADYTDVVSGSLTNSVPVAVTPEPSSLLLLGSGVMALGAILRRRSPKGLARSGDMQRLYQEQA